ncbi:phosphatidate cytidylyltransferase [Paenibacillus xerothermodurans]|uniref:Phosphatidate cytidylyltransferase n=1 Tax=Paenibacillus xerothermodurans TaxID=1977292 RepID=A0A2W1NCH9_PAEXE|nr:phosphatidate cytidylyltransferase [Paenibacillus xerothermodurans]PZE22419.1 phosphatidate cytidylyltransferase [Paenibacillus xerothermodurans]
MKQRVITGLTAGLVFLVLLYLGTFWYAGLIILLAIVGFDEFARMNGLKQYKATTWLGYLGVVCLAVPWQISDPYPVLSIEQLIWFFLFIYFCVTVISKNKVTIDQIAMSFLGMVYIGTGFHYMIETRMLDNGGLFWTLLVFFCIWGTDSGAYFVGSAIGKRPLWPTISPNKSIEGALGGIIVSVAVALCFWLARPDTLSWLDAVLLGAVIAIVGQMGDLIQSAYKRAKGIKDTGAILPGHGGVLDRVDSWLIVFPAVHLFALIPHT